MSQAPKEEEETCVLYRTVMERERSEVKKVIKYTMTKGKKPKK